jgi:hypothetical protein
MKSIKSVPIHIVSTVKGLDLIEECRPQPAIKFLPEWWKKTKHIPQRFSYPLGKSPEVFAGNVKSCPSFPDFFSQGFIIPMWTDTILRYNKKTTEYSWHTSNSDFTWDIHSHEQYIDDVNHSFLSKKASMVFKANSPWRMITPKGYSVLQLPLFYHFNDDFTVMPGIVDTDIHSQLNQQVLYMSDKDEILIKRGTPFVQYIPFKRISYSYQTGYMTNKQKNIFEIQDHDVHGRFGGSNWYRDARRKRDNN